MCGTTDHHRVFKDQIIYVAFTVHCMKVLVYFAFDIAAQHSFTWKVATELLCSVHESARLLRSAIGLQAALRGI